MNVYVITKYVDHDETHKQTLGIAKTKRKAKQKIIDDVNKCFAGHVKIKWCQGVNGIAEVDNIMYLYTKVKI